MKITAKQIGGYLQARREPLGMSENDAYNVPTYGLTAQQYRYINDAMRDAYGMMRHGYTSIDSVKKAIKLFKGE